MRNKEFLEDLNVDGKIIVKWIFKKRYGGTNWFHILQARNRGR